MVEAVWLAYRSFLNWRRQHPALRHGSMRFVDAPDDALCFLREFAGQALLCCFNFGPEPCTLKLPTGSTVEVLAGHGFKACEVGDSGVRIDAAGAFFGYLTQ